MDNESAPSSYLRATEPAMRHFFDGLTQYDSIRLPSIAEYVDETGVVRMTRQQNQAFLKAYEEHFDLEFARATLAGSILQVAYMALKQHARPSALSNGYPRFEIPPGSDILRFCTGRETHGIPIGLLIYAGRVQYNHWDSGEPSGKAAKNVFRELVHAYYDNPYFDMAYVLEWPGPRPVAHYIVRLELQWRSYDKYLEDINSLLDQVDEVPSSA